MKAAAPATEYRLAELERWRGQIEEIHPDVLAEQIGQLTRRVDTLVKVGFSILVSLVGAGAAFVFMALTALGRP